MPLRNSFGRNAYFLYRRQGILGRIGSYIPQPLKVFAGVAGLAAATVVLAPAILILATPPLICGAWLIHKRRQAFAQLAEQLHHQRWQDLASFHLQQVPAGEKSERIPTFARIAVEAALKSNEQGLRTKLGPGELQFGELEALAQDFSAATHGIAEKMSMAQYGLLLSGRKAGSVRVVQRQGVESGTRAARARIEVQLLDGSLLVLKNNDHSGSVIEGHGHRIA